MIKHCKRCTYSENIQEGVKPAGFRQHKNGWIEPVCINCLNSARRETSRFFCAEEKRAMEQAALINQLIIPWNRLAQP